MNTRSPRSSFHHFVVASVGTSRSTARPSASAARRTSVKSQRGSMRTLTWMPREPERLREADECRAPRAPRGRRRRPRGTASKATPGCGSRSTRSSSGWSTSSRRTGHGLRSRHPRFTAHTRWAASTGHSSSAVRPLGNVTSHGLEPVGAPLAGPASGRTARPSAPSGKRLSTVGRSNTPRERALTHREVVVRRGRAWSRRGPRRTPCRDSRPGPCARRPRPRSPVSARKSPYSLGILASFDCRRSPTRLGRRGRKPTFFLA